MVSPSRLSTARLWTVRGVSSRAVARKVRPSRSPVVASDRSGPPVRCARNVTEPFVDSRSPAFSAPALTQVPKGVVPCEGNRRAVAKSSSADGFAFGCASTRTGPHAAAADAVSLEDATGSARPVPSGALSSAAADGVASPSHPSTWNGCSGVVVSVVVHDAMDSGGRRWGGGRLTS